MTLKEAVTKFKEDKKYSTTRVMGANTPFVYTTFLTKALDDMAEVLRMKEILGADRIIEPLEKFAIQILIMTLEEHFGKLYNKETGIFEG